MAYDRYENRGGWRDDDRRGPGQRGDRDERGFFERAREEVSSWFSDEEDSDHRRYGDMRGERSGRGEDRGAFFGGGQSSSYGRGREGGDYRNQYGRGGGESGGFGSGDYSQQNRSSWRGGRDEDRDRGYPGSYGQTGGGSFRSRGGGERWGFGGRDEDDRSGFGRSSSWGGGRDEDDYRPMAGDYGRSGQQSYRSGMGGQDFSREQYGRQEFSQDQDRDRGSGGRTYNFGGWGDRDSERSSRMGGGRHDEHYSQWRQRQIEELDRDYDEYRREHQSKFENEFSGWRTQRQTKRQMLQSIREHNEVVDQNGERIGTVDKVRGDTVILTKNDPEAGGVHRSFTCSLLDRVEDGKVYLTGTADSIRGQLREEREDDRERGGFMGALFGRSDEDRPDERQEERSQTAQGGEGPHILDRSFSGTYEEGDSRKKR